MKNIKYTLIGLLYVNTIVLLCFATMYAKDYHIYKSNMEIKKAAAEILNFPDLSN